MARKKQVENGVETLERGNIYFFYRPRVGEHSPEEPTDVQRLYLVQSVYGRPLYRLSVVGRKVLPEPGEQTRSWGFVDMVRSDAREISEVLRGERYQTKTRGGRERPAARPAGEGVYQFVRHNDHTHLVYALELPDQLGEVQEAFHIHEEASYIAGVKNPEAPAPRAAGRGRERKADYPKSLREAFRGRRFAEVDPPQLLDYEGAEFLLIGAAEDVTEELGIELHPQDESEATAEVFSDLRIQKSKHPIKPLLEGEWE